MRRKESHTLEQPFNVDPAHKPIEYTLASNDNVVHPVASGRSSPLKAYTLSRPTDKGITPTLFPTKVANAPVACTRGRWIKGALKQDSWLLGIPTFFSPLATLCPTP